MAQLIFFDQGHTYTLDGEEVPSVSQLCRFLSREIYGTVAQYTLDRAADRGTRVHKACEALDVYGKVNVTEDIAPYVTAYLKFRQEHEVAWSMVERSLAHPKERYAGTIDRYGTLDGRKALVDLKTTYTVHKPMATAQLNLYRWMVEEEGHAVDKLYILHLKKDGYKLVEIEKRDDVPTALLTLHRLMEKKRRNKKQNVCSD